MITTSHVTFIKGSNWDRYTAISLDYTSAKNYPAFDEEAFPTQKIAAKVQEVFNNLSDICYEEVLPDRWEVITHTTQLLKYVGKSIGYTPLSPYFSWLPHEIVYFGYQTNREPQTFFIREEQSLPGYYSNTVFCSRVVYRKIYDNGLPLHQWVLQPFFHSPSVEDRSGFFPKWLVEYPIDNFILQSHFIKMKCLPPKSSYRLRDKFSANRAKVSLLTL